MWTPTWATSAGRHRLWALVLSVKFQRGAFDLVFQVWFLCRDRLPEAYCLVVLGALGGEHRFDCPLAAGKSRVNM